MSNLTDRCVLCDQPIVTGYVGGMTYEARRIYESHFGLGASTDMPAICDSCMKLPPEERQAAARQELRRTLGEMYDDMSKFGKPPLDREAFIDAALKQAKK